MIIVCLFICLFNISKICKDTAHLICAAYPEGSWNSRPPQLASSQHASVD